MVTRLRGKRVLVFGLGLHGGGVTVAKWCVKQGARVTVTDLRTRRQLKISLDKLADDRIDFVLGRHRREDVLAADLIIKNPGVPPSSPYLRLARRNGIPVTTDIGLFIERHRGPIYAVTGTKGKTTTATMLWKMLRHVDRRTALAGNTGLSPLTLLTTDGYVHPVVLELSSWQIEDLPNISWSPRIAICTNIYPDHLNRHKTMRAYVHAKLQLFTHQHARDISILSHDSPQLRRAALSLPGRILWFGNTDRVPKPRVIYHGDRAVAESRTSSKTLFTRGDLRVPGEHTMINALAAAGAAWSAGVPSRAIQKALRTFTGVPGRYEVVRTLRGVTYINDTTATTPQAAQASLETTGRKTILISGGADKDLTYMSLARSMKKYAQHIILLPGSATKKIRSALDLLHVPYSFAKTMPIAVRRAARIAERGSTVLLSPGCASFGVFVHEFDRGHQFTAAVRHLSP